MDVVYIVGPGRRPWLRWSLRSLANIDHDRVWIVGVQPEGLRDVSHIPVAQGGPPNINSTVNVAAACDHSDVSDPFLLFNDDFFILQPLDRVPVFHNGPVPPGTLARGQNSWQQGQIQTCRLMGDWGITEPLSYELHIPLPVHKGLMADVIRRAQPAAIKVLHKRSLYGNVADLGGTFTEDCKITQPNQTWQPGDRFVSTSKTSWNARTGEDLRAAFPDRSPYETPERRVMSKNDTITIDELTRVKEFDRASGRTVLRVFHSGDKVPLKRARQLGIVGKSKSKSEPKPSEPPAEKPLSKMNKAELLAKAAEVGVEADEEMTNKAIAAAIEAAGQD